VDESANDLRLLQELLDASNAAAGPHLREVITTERQMTALEVCSHLTGMRLIALSTVTADNRPLVGPVDGVFYRGAFHFGSAPNSVRIQHIRQRRAVSGTYLKGEELSITVHGNASILDMRESNNAALRRAVLDIYTPKYGREWEAFLDANVYARIEATRMFTFLSRENSRPDK
jgi:nitroimidazol reductase NimA-like FMN-containing flavoprotein (pyridoxamine 5'-phosphate oxidase superfamily)